MTEFRAKANKLLTLIPLVIGGMLLFYAIDVFVLHRFLTIEEGTSLVPAVVAGLLGLVFFSTAAKSLFAPATVLLADSRGITIYPSRHIISNKGRKESLTIPWDSVLTITEGKMTSGTTRVCRGGNTVKTVVSEKERYAPAVKLLVAPSINLDNCSVHGALQTRTGTPPESVTNEDREHFSDTELDEYMKTECLVSKAVLSKNVAQSIQALTSMMNQNK
jgi:hypothetical protein